MKSINRIAGYIDRFGKDEYNIYTPDPDADADDVTVDFEADVLLLDAGHVGLEGVSVLVLLQVLKV